MSQCCHYLLLCDLHFNKLNSPEGSVKLSVEGVGAEGGERSGKGELTGDEESSEERGGTGGDK